MAVLGGDGGDADDGVGVFGVDVEDRDRQALGEVGGEARGVGLFRVGGEAEEIVDDDVDRAADVVAVECGEVEGFRPDALAGEGRVAVDDDGEDLAGSIGADAILAGAGAAHATGSTASRWLGLETRWRARFCRCGRAEVAGGAHVVLHVAAAQDAAGVDVFEFGEDLGGRSAEGVDHDVEAAAMAHGEDGALRAGSAARLRSWSRKGMRTVRPSSEKRLVPR